VAKPGRTKGDRSKKEKGRDLSASRLEKKGEKKNTRSEEKRKSTPASKIPHTPRRKPRAHPSRKGKYARFGKGKKNGSPRRTINAHLKEGKEHTESLFSVPYKEG